MAGVKGENVPASYLKENGQEGKGAGGKGQAVHFVSLARSGGHGVAPGPGGGKLGQAARAGDFPGPRGLARILKKGARS